jgi:subtilisin family serine protease
MAPGEGIYGPASTPGFPAFSSYFTTNSGTSFSVPLVSGLAALILSQNPACRRRSSSRPSGRL